MRLPLKTKLTLTAAIVVFSSWINASGQSVWRFKTRSITVTEDGIARTSLFIDSSKLSAIQQRTTTNTCPPNIDFESGNFTSWQCYTGSANASGGVNTVTGLTLSGVVSTRHTMISSTTVPALDPYGAFSVRCPNGSGYSVKLGNSGTGSQAERIRYTFTVPASANDFNLVYNYAVVFQNPQTDHTVAEQPRFQAKVYDAVTGNGIACANYDFIATAGLPGFTVSSCTNCNPANTAANPVLFKNWTPVTINLSGFAGRNMILEFTTEDCTKGGHFGYAYVDVNSGCSGLVSGAAYCQGATTVTLNAPPGYQSYNWYNSNYSQLLGTGTTLTLTPPPPTNTTINIDLVPYPGFGCRDTVYTTVTVNPKPVAGFDIDTLPVCMGSSPTFGNTSTISNGTMTYLWKFGDNSTSPGQNPTHTYSSIGTYNVRLVTTSDIGCKDSITKPVTIVPNPLASFNINSVIRQCIAGNNFSFQNTSPSGSGINYIWTWGDGNTSTAGNPNHSYNATGTYNVKLLALQPSNNSCRDSMIKPVIVDPSPAVAFGFYNTGRQCFKNNLFKFKNNTTSHVPITYQWDFGDGNTSAQTEPEYSFAAPGVYQVKLVAAASGLCKDSITIAVTVDPSPAAGFLITSNTTQCQDNNQFTFQDISSVSSGNLSYAWNFADANSSSLQDPAHSYAIAGVFSVKLIVTTSAGCSDTATHFLTVNPKPAAGFSIAGGNEQCFRSNNFDLQNTTTIPAGSFSQDWFFGDAASTSQPDANHHYTATGAYTVKLIATSNYGCIDSIAKNITVNPDPTAAFTIDDATQCLRDNNFTFSNNSTLSSGVLSYLWDFGDASNSGQQHPVKSYSTFASSYQVRLISATAKGCKDTAYKQVYLFQNPTAAFSINSPTQQCEKDNLYQFSNTSSFASGLTYQWNFGNGNTSTQPNTSNHYNTQGIYDVKLVAATVENGCTDTLVKSIQVFKNPGAGFTVNTTPQCLTGNNFSFGNTSVGANFQYQWLFGDAATANTATSSHSYTSANNYSVRLIVDHPATPTLTCSDTSFQTIVVNAMPVGFITNKGNYDLCQGAIKPLNASGGATYQWFLNGTTINGATAATHNAVVEGVYTLDAINQFGCRAASADSAFINEIKKPSANFTWDSYCINKAVKFSNTSSAGSHNIAKYAWNFDHGGASSFDTAANPQHTYTPAGTYKVKLAVTSALCPAHLSVMEKTINIENLLAGIRYSPINAVIGNTYILSARTVGVKYQWTPATDLTNPTSRTPALKATGEKDYKVILTTSSGCQSTDSIKILIFSQSQVLVPKAFTPNNDGLNDVLYPILVGIKQLKYFKVYNRWGNLVFSTATAQVGWDGIFRGQLQPSETFVWVAEAIDEKGNTIHNGGNTILIR